MTFATKTPWLMGLGAVALGLSSHVTAKSAGFSIEDITKVQSVTNAQVSPSGDHVAFTRSVPRELYKDKNGRSFAELYITNDKGDAKPYITGKVNVGSISWDNAGEYVYFLAKMNDDKFTSLYRIAQNGGQAQKVLSLKGTSISRYEMSEDGKKVALIAKPAPDKSKKELKKLGFMAEVYEEELTNTALYLVNLAKSDKPLTPTALPIDGYISDVEFSPKSDVILVKTKPTALIDDTYTKSRWHVYNLNDEKVTLTFATEGKLGAAEMSHDGQYIAILGAEDKHDPATGRLFLADLKSNKVTDWLPNFMGHIGDFEWANTSNTLHFVANVDVDTYIASIKPGSSKYKVQLKPGKVIASRLSLSDSDKTLAFTGHSATHTNEAFILRGKKHTRLTDSNPWFSERRFAKQEEVRFNAPDGTELGGVLIYPLDYEEGQRYPLIMSVHGGPEAHDKNGWLTNYSRPGQMGAARGYAVLYPNYRGSTGKGVDYSKLGQNDYAGKEFDDLVSFKRHLVERGIVDGKRVGITGGSYGGYASAWAATKLTEEFATSVMFVGISNQLSKFGTTDIPTEMHLVHARSYPWDKWQYYLERSPIYWAGQSKTPLLIMHGKEDPRVHPAQSMELYRYMKVQGKDVRLVYYPGEGHGNRKNAAQYDYSLRLMRWMDNYLIEGNSTMPSHELPHKDNLKAKKDEDKA